MKCKQLKQNTSYTNYHTVCIKTNLAKIRHLKQHCKIDDDFDYIFFFFVGQTQWSLCTQDIFVRVIVEVWPHSSHCVALLGKTTAGDGVDVEFPVEVVDSGNKPFGPFFIKPLNLIGSDFSIEHHVIHIAVETNVPLTFWRSWFDNLCAFRLSRNVMSDPVWHTLYQREAQACAYAQKQTCHFERTVLSCKATKGIVLKRKLELADRHINRKFIIMRLVLFFKE